MTWGIAEALGSGKTVFAKELGYSKLDMDDYCFGYNMMTNNFYTLALDIDLIINHLTELKK